MVSNARVVGQVDHIGIEGEVLHNLVANRKIDALGCVLENNLRGVDGYVVQPIRSVLIFHAGGEAIFLIKERQVGDPLRCTGKGDFALVRSLKIAINEKTARLPTKAITETRPQGKEQLMAKYEAVEQAAS